MRADNAPNILSPQITDIPQELSCGVVGQEDAQSVRIGLGDEVLYDTNAERFDCKATRANPSEEL